MRRRLVGALRTATACLTIWSYLFIAPLAYLGFAVMAFLWRRDPLRRTRRMQSAMARAYRFVHDWMRIAGALNFNARHRIEGIPDGPCIVIANHPTLVDITSITAMLGGACTIVKPELYQRWFLHPMLAASGHIEGPGRALDQERTRLLIEESVQWLDDGFKIVVFPEGTRSVQGKLRPFGRTSFEVACRANVPVVALTIDVDPPYLTKETSMYRPPVDTAQLRMGLLGVFHPSDLGGDSRALCRHVEAQYRARSEAALGRGAAADSANQRANSA